jgi:alpha-mannosidase
MTLRLAMSYQEQLVLLPCHSFEDFPIYHEGVAAEGLLAAFTALWHPALLASSRRLPAWHRADIPPAELAGRLLVVPEVAESWLPTDFFARAESEGATLVRGETHRAEIVSQALAKLSDPPQFSAEVVADFFALGFCRLQVELLTRVMRYTTTIDDVRLQIEVLAAVDAASAGDDPLFREHLRAAFEQLNESRKYFFPVDPYLVDLTLVAESTLGEPLRAQLQDPTPANVLITGELLEQLARCESPTLEALKQAVENATVTVVGGEYQEQPFPLLPEETWCADLLRGIATHERILGRRPKAYARRRAGLSPLLPQLLCRTGFHAALHFTLDDGQFPISPNSKARWDSPDGSVVEALSQVPRDAAKPEPFLELSRRLGEALDREQVATLVFAHWPGITSPWYDELRRVARYTAALGKFITLDEYFATTLTAGSFSDFRPDDYRMPYLEQDVARGVEDPLSQFIVAQKKQIETANRGAIALLSKPIYDTNPSLVDDPFQRWPTPPHVPLNEADPVSQMEINPNSFAVQRTVALGSLGRDANTQEPFFRPGTISVPIQVPSMGFAWVTPASLSASAKHPNKPMLEGNTIRNEFCEVTISEITGSIQSVNDYRTRRNRLSQQIALRNAGSIGAPGSMWRDPDQDAIYSVMVAEQVSGMPESGLGAMIASSGRLVDRDGKRLAGFKQLTWLQHGDPLIRIHLELQVDELPRQDPWNSYYAVRFAFPDADLQWSRGIGLGQHATEARRIHSPLFVEAESSGWRTAILSGGLPYHRLVQDRNLDTLLIVHGESQRSFDLGIAMDAPNPAAAALALISLPESRFVPKAVEPKIQSAWLFHLGAKNAIATAWEQIDDSGFRVRVRETMGAAGRVCLRSWRPIKSARQTDFLGNTLAELTVEDDRIWCDMSSFEWIQIEALFT